MIDELASLAAPLYELADTIETKPEHWIHADPSSNHHGKIPDEAVSFCRDCCEKRVEALKATDPEGDYHAGGGYGVEGDCTPFCEDCSARLENSLTNWGAHEEIGHFEQYGFDRECADDCWSMLQAMDALGPSDREKIDAIKRIIERGKIEEGGNG
jgi:hypothetical protein